MSKGAGGMTIQERNRIVESNLGAIGWTIRKNRALIRAAGLEVEDVFQALAVRLIRAVDGFDPARGSLECHIFQQLQYEMLNCKDGARISGIKGAPYQARGLTVSLDAMLERRSFRT